MVTNDGLQPISISPLPGLNASPTHRVEHTPRPDPTGTITQPMMPIRLIDVPEFVRVCIITRTYDQLTIRP